MRFPVKTLTKAVPEDGVMVIFPDVVVAKAKSPDVELIVREPAPPSSIATPEPALERLITAPVAEAYV